MSNIDVRSMETVEEIIGYAEGLEKALECIGQSRAFKSADITSPITDTIIVVVDVYDHNGAVKTLRHAVVATALVYDTNCLIVEALAQITNQVRRES